jgi:23S rRNA (uracil1939-C5)-methyltransferase
MKKNEEFTLKIDDLTVDGHGLGRYEGQAVFVPGALPGETAKVSAIKIAKNYAVARLLELIEPSPDRTAPPCGDFKACGGCTLQHLSYEKQLAYKTYYVKNCLKRIGGLEIPVLPCAASPNTTGYRNKSSFPVAPGKEGLVTGFYSPHSHRVVDISSCGIQDEAANRVLSAVREFAARYDIAPYDETAHTGLLRHIVVRSAKNGEVMAALVINGKKLPHAAECADLLREKVPGLASFIVNRNEKKTNVILGETEEVVFGNPYITEEMLGLSFRVSLQSFLQVNREQAENLYKKALDYAALTPDDIVADLYCGIGTLTLAAARQAKKVYGIESVPDAVENANENMQLNGIGNAAFICGDCAEKLPELFKRESGVSAVLLDPPRRGCERAVLDALTEAKPERIVYVSCDAATLARDLKILAEGGYTAKEAAPYDMFPQTTHVECCCLLTKIK